MCCLYTDYCDYIFHADRVHSRCSTKVCTQNHQCVRKTISERQSTMDIYFDHRGAAVRAYTQGECRSTETTPTLFFFHSPQLHPKRSINHPVMAAPRFLFARVYMPAHTRSRRSIYIEFIPYREFILRIPSRSFLPEGRVVPRVESGRTLRLFPLHSVCASRFYINLQNIIKYKRWDSFVLSLQDDFCLIMIYQFVALPFYASPDIRSKKHRSIHLLGN